MALSHKMISDQIAQEKAQAETVGREEELDEVMEEKLVRKLEAADRKTQVDPPPELSPAEKKERALDERIAALEGKQQPVKTLNPNPENQELSRYRNQLKLLRTRKEIRDKDRAERATGVRDRRDAFETEQTRIEAERDSAIEQITARAQAERAAAREQAESDIQAARAACAEDVASKVQKASDPRAKALLAEAVSA